MQVLAVAVWLITLEPRVSGSPVWRWWKDQWVFMLRWNDAPHCIMSSANVILIGLQIIVTSTTSNKSSGYLNTWILLWGPMKGVKNKRKQKQRNVKDDPVGKCQHLHKRISPFILSCTWTSMARRQLILWLFWRCGWLIPKQLNDQISTCELEARRVVEHIFS